ncbi:MAG: hypothetical protein QNL99_13325 [SAR86 cluster bacterium]|jgi:uncharacterized lipoprotein YajG|uniref:Uncharacterized protein n=1 Tax=SAR86 cluster bacterium TaxID=2030880 RepID=A0A972VXR8_9GAMM|nr:hypothetical protein [SAR86 cluster bacterium]|tara:strand:- start:152 stop:367 length:216 start_codon:yes stop_codon:yes gene_type:complete
MKNITLTFATLALLAALLAGCGGSAEVAEPVTKPVSNPLAVQQQAMRDAAAVQAIINKDAAGKQKALSIIP